MRDKARAFYGEALFRNSIFLMLTTATKAGLGFFFWLLAAHLYSSAKVGIASTLISSMSFIAYFSLLGFDSTFIRFLPTSKIRNDQTNTGLVFVGAAALLASLLFVIFAPDFAPRLGLLHGHFLYAAGFVLLSLAATLNLLTDSIFIAHRAAVYNLFIDGLISSSLQLILPLALVGLGAFGIYAAQGAAALIALILSFYVLVQRFNYRPSIRIRKAVWRDVLHYSSANYLASLFNTLPVIVLPIIILNKLGAADAGYYYLAFMVANVLFAIAYAVAQALFAEGSYGDRALILLANRAILFLAALMIPASLLLAGLGPFILRVFGNDYSNHARQVIIILAAVGPLLAVGAVGSVIMRVAKHTKALILTSALYASLICGLALVWAHRGLAWVAGAWLAGQAATTLATYGVLWFYYRRHELIARKPA